jgi:hypothetical protein
MKAQGPRPRASGVLSLAIFLLITGVLGRDVLANLGSTIANDAGDPLLTAAILKWNATHLPFTDAWYQFPIFFPTRDTLTFSEHLLGLSVIASPIYWLTQDTVVTYNIVLLLTFPLCAMAMYALVFRLTGSVAGAFVAGLAFAFAPYRISQLPHIQMLATFWAPLALLGLHVFLETGRRRWLVLYGTTWVLQGAANGYALVMFSVLVGLWCLWFVVLKRKWRALLMIGLASVVALLPLVPVLYHYMSVHSSRGFVRDYWEIRGFSADIAAVLCAPPLLELWGWVRVKCGPEGELFPGVALMSLTIAGFAGLIVRSWRSDAATSGRYIIVARWFLLFVAALYSLVIAAMLLWGPFEFAVGSINVRATTFSKPVQLVALCTMLALAMSPGVRDLVQRSRVIGFYVFAAILTWALALGPITMVMGKPGIPGPYHLLMSLPGVDSLRVPARFWLMTTICLSAIVGLLLADFLRKRSRRTTAVAVTLAAIAILSDGWIARIPTAPLPPSVPGAAALADALVLEAPPDRVGRDIQAVFRAVNGGWRTVNGYSGWSPSYYDAFVSAARVEVDDMVTPFQRFGDLYVLVEQNAPRIRAVIERQPGVTRVTSDSTTVVYRLPMRSEPALAWPDGKRLQPRELRSGCSSAFLANALDGNEATLWQCGLWDQRQWLTIDLGQVETVGSVVHSMGTQYWLFPSGLEVELSEDGLTWSTVAAGPVLARAIVSAMENPRHLRLVMAFPPRQARLIRLRAAPADTEAPWTIAELEVWSSSTQTR